MRILPIDVICLTITEEDLKKNVGEQMKWPIRSIPYTEGVTWKITVYPAGSEASLAGHVSLAAFVHNPYLDLVRFRFELDGINFHKEIETSEHNRWISLDKFASHRALQPYLINVNNATDCIDLFKLTCTIQIKTVVTYMPVVPRLFQACKHAPTDFKLVVGSNEIDVHKGYLALISPVFQAIICHDTIETRLGRSEVTDLDFDTVDAGVDYIYGRGICSNEVTMESVVRILRFAHKYDIKGITNQLEPLCYLSVKTFSPIVHYAYVCSKESLLADCIDFLKTHANNINRIDKLVDLPPEVLFHLLQNAFGLKTHFDMCQFANKNGISAIVDVIEQPLITKMILDDFCPAVTYAWEYSRDRLKNACALFFNDNRDETRSLKEFHTLPTETISELLELANKLKTVK